MDLPNSTDELLTVAEVAELLKLNQQTIRNWIDRNELPALRLGSRRVRIRRVDLDAKLKRSWTGQEQTADVEEQIDLQLRRELVAVIDLTRAELADRNAGALAEVLRQLVDAANRLAAEVERSAKSVVTDS